MRNTNVDNIRNVIARCSCDICIIYTHMYGYLQRDIDIDSGKKITTFLQKKMRREIKTM